MYCDGCFYEPVEVSNSSMVVLYQLFINFPMELILKVISAGCYYEVVQFCYKMAYKRNKIPFIKFICSLLIINKLQSVHQYIFQMQRKILSELNEFPGSKAIQPVKQGLSKLMLSVAADKNLSSSSREDYLSILKQIDWWIGKVNPRWPSEVERMMESLVKHIQDFELALVQANNTGICGGGRAIKNVETSFRNIIGFKQAFPVIGHYQDKNLREELVNSIITLYQKHNPREQKPPRQIIKQVIRQVPIHIPVQQSLPPIQQPVVVEQPKTQKLLEKKCEYCDLYLALSIKPNAYLAKQLLKNLPDTQWLYGILYEQGKIFDRNLATAISYFQKAANKGNTDSLYRLGELNERGEYGKPMQYIDMWKKAAEGGNLQAMTDMGFLYQNGIESETGETVMQKDYNKAQQYYLKAAKQNFPRAMNNLGSFYLQNPNFKNIEKSQQYFNKAIEGGYIKAHFNLGICYTKGLLKTVDKQKGKALFKRGAQLGDQQSKLFYVDMLLNNDPNSCSQEELMQAHQYCRQMIAYEEDRAEAYYFLGVMNQAGLGTQQDLKTAFLYYLKSAKLDYVHAIVKLADWYRTGTGVEQDFKQAIRYYEKVLQVQPEALVSIGAIYEEGSEDVKRDYQKAYSYYQYAINKGVAEGYFKMAQMYKNGKYLKINVSKANEYMRKGQQLQRENEAAMDKTHLMQQSRQSELIQSSYFRSMQKKR